MKRSLRRKACVLGIGLSLLLTMAGCGGGGGKQPPPPPPTVSVSITSPTSAQTVLVNGTLAITASVSGTTNTSVTWTVNGVANGNATFGTITGLGLSVTYNAPASVPNPATFNITATSAADGTKSASVSVTIAVPVAVSITTPTSPQSLNVSSSLGFTASVTGTSNTAVTWTVNGVTNGNSTFGTITGSGLSVTYNAPASVPSPATFNITAISVADGTKSASVSVTITAPVVAVSMTTPTSPQSLMVSSSLGFTAAVTGTSNTAVTWTVNSITNGNATFGTITGSGLSVTYNAPASVPSPATFNVTATSVADNTKSASVSVTITAGVAVSMITPASPQSLAVSSTLGFTASVTGTPNTAVTWTVNSITNGNSTFGTITGSGLSVTYNAPASIPSPATFNITATSVADNTKSASVSVTITTAPVVTLNGSASGSTSVTVGGSLAITALVTGTSTTTLNFTVAGALAGTVANGNATLGTITGSYPSFTYNAPAALPTGNNPVTITATSTVGGTPATLTVTVNPSGSSPNAINVPGGTDATGIGFNISTSAPTLAVNDVGTCTSLTPPLTCAGGVGSITIAKGSTVIVWLVGHGMTNSGGTALTSGLSVTVSQGTSSDVTVSQVTPQNFGSTFTHIAFQVQVSASATTGPRNIVVTNGAGELQAFIGAIQIQ